MKKRVPKQKQNSHADYLDEKQLAAEIDVIAADLDKEYAGQSKERDAWLNDPKNADEVAAMFEQMDLLVALHKARTEAGLTQKELADRMGISQVCVAQIEKGRRNLTLRTLRRYARACGKKIAVTLI